MQLVPIQAVPNQSLSINLDNNQWGITLKTTNGCTSVSITLNGNTVVDNTRAVANNKIIPYIYQEQNSGNFLFITQNFQLPYYTEFNITQYLVYVSAAELAVARVQPTTLITASDFDPIAALPLRFSPQGYTTGGLINLEGSTYNIFLEGDTSFVSTEGTA